MDTQDFSAYKDFVLVVIIIINFSVKEIKQAVFVCIFLNIQAVHDTKHECEKSHENCNIYVKM